MAKRVLCLLAPGFEEIETITPVDLLRRAGAEVMVASVTDDLHVTGRSGITIHAEATFADAADVTYDLLFIPGGPGVKALRADGQAAKLAQAYSEAGKLIGAICAAPTVLADAGLLVGKRYTAHFSVHGELPDALAEPVVVDGDLITSRGAGTALQFGLALVGQLFGPDKVDEVAASIMA